MASAQDLIDAATAAAQAAVTAALSFSSGSNPSNRTVDHRVLGKPPVFSGKEMEWQNWSFMMLAYVGSLDSEMLQEIEQSQKLKSAIVMSSLSAAS